MNHLKVLGIKLIVISIIVYSLFGILFNASLINLLWISLLVTGISYLIGDLFALRKYGNIVASIADFPLAFLLLWVLGNLFIDRGMPIALLSLTGAFFITLCEPLIHAYMQNKFSDYVQEDSPTINQLQTEFAEETDSETTINKKHDS